MISTHSFHIAYLTRPITDASNFQNSDFWDPDTTSGVGGWGDPNDDNQITSGGFVNFTVSYPAPHRIRRQYTPIGSNGESLAAMFTPESQRAMVNGSVGNYVSFQATFESTSHGAVHRIVGGSVNYQRVVVSPTHRAHVEIFWGIVLQTPLLVVHPALNGPPMVRLCLVHIYGMHNFDVLIDPLFMMHHSVRGMNASGSIF